MEIIDPDPNPIDTITVDTTTIDTIVYEDAPIWLPGAQEHGFAKGLKNGKEFEASAEAYYLPAPNEGFLGIFMDTYSDRGYRREILAVGGISENDDEEYKISDKIIQNEVVSARYGTLIDGGDVLGDEYNLDTLNSNNQIKIISIDLEKKEIEGVFSTSFNFDERHAKREPRNPNYCVFEEIYFKCKIVD